MRFALMTEPQQGLSYVEQLEIWRGCASGSASRPSFAPTTTAASPDRQTAQRPMPGRCWQGSPARPRRIRLGSARVAGHVPPSGVVRQGRDDRRRDERRPHRGRRRRRLERPRAQRTGPRLPGDRRAGRPHGGRAGHPARAVGAARRLVVRGQAGFDRERAVFHPKPVQRPHPPIIVGGEGSPRSLRLAARLRGRIQHVQFQRRTCAREAFAMLDEECRKIGRDPATIARFGHGRLPDRRGRSRVRAAGDAIS